MTNEANGGAVVDPLAVLKLAYEAVSVDLEGVEEKLLQVRTNEVALRRRREELREQLSRLARALAPKAKRVRKAVEA